MAALSHVNGQTHPSFDINGETSTLTIFSADEMNEDDFIF